MVYAQSVVLIALISLYSLSTYNLGRLLPTLV